MLSVPSFDAAPVSRMSFKDTGASVVFMVSRQSSVPFSSYATAQSSPASKGISQCNGS